MEKKKVGLLLIYNERKFYSNVIEANKDDIENLKGIVEEIVAGNMKSFSMETDDEIAYFPEYVLTRSIVKIVFYN